MLKTTVIYAVTIEIDVVLKEYIYSKKMLFILLMKCFFKYFCTETI